MGNPSKTVDAEVPARVFEAFGMTPLDPRATVTVPPVKKPTFGGRVDPPLPKPKAENQTDLEPTEIADFLKRLERWREVTPETALSQGDSSRLRKLIGETVFNAINWESLLLQQIKASDSSFAWKNIYIPNAKGNQSTEEDAFLVVATEAALIKDDANLQVFMGLRALIRFDHYKDWNYKDGENDYARLANFIESRLPSASKWVVQRYQNVKGDLVPVLAQSLLWQSRILNFADAHRADDASLISAMFQSEIPDQQKDDDLNWQHFLKECELARPHLLDSLVERIAARQGTGKTVHAIDVSQLLTSVKDLKKEWAITESFAKLPNNPSESLQTAREHFTTLSRRGPTEVKNRRKKVLAESKQVMNELGESFDKNELVKTFEEVIEASQKNGLPGDVKSGQMKKLVEAFRVARSKEVLDQIKVIGENESGGAMLSAIATLDGQTHKLLVEFAANGAQFVNERIGAAKAKIGDWTDEVVRSKTDEVDSLLTELETIANEFVGDKQ